MSERCDLWPPERIEAIKAKKKPLESTLSFIKSYHFHVEQGLHIPLHWHQFASDILYRAAVLAESNPEAREGLLAEEMGLQGLKSKSKDLRDFYIAYCVKLLINRGDRVGVAQDKVANKFNLGIHSIKSIWRKRNKREIEYMAKEFSKTDI